MSGNYEKIVKDLLATAQINIGGVNPWDIQVHNENFYKRVMTEGELGMGESYMEGWWDAGKVDEAIFRILRCRLDEYIRNKFSISLKMFLLGAQNLQSRKRAFLIGQKHYDLGNDLFQLMLDKRMNYSCAYWADTDELDKAQEKKLDLVCRKLYLKPGMRILDIGCGWGAFGKYAAEKYHVKVLGITVSKEQVELGKKLCKSLPVEFQLEDYRDVIGCYDRIVSIGMIEHVGYSNYRDYFRVASHCLKDDGLFLLQTIGNNKSVELTDLWTHKYIFPNGMLPSMGNLGKATENLFVIEDLHNFATDYDKTLMAWYHNFEMNWDRVKERYPGYFYRMWKYYLLSSAGAFRARNIQLWQIVLSRHGILNGYKSIR